MDQINILLELVGNSAVPHGNGEEIAVGDGEPGGDVDDLVPQAGLGSLVRAAAEHRQLGFVAVAVELGQACVPEFDYVHLKGGIGDLQGGEIGVGDRDGPGCAMARRGLDVEQLGHGEFPKRGVCDSVISGPASRGGRRRRRCGRR